MESPDTSSEQPHRSFQLSGPDSGDLAPLLPPPMQKALRVMGIALLLIGVLLELIIHFAPQLWPLKSYGGRSVPYMIVGTLFLPYFLVVGWRYKAVRHATYLTGILLALPVALAIIAGWYAVAAAFVGAGAIVLGFALLVVFMPSWLAGFRRMRETPNTQEDPPFPGK